MKKLLGSLLLLALCASSAFALGAPPRVQGLRFGTWTPTGFEASSDTTFISGATQQSDTTEAFNAANVYWGSMGYDANGVTPVFRVWVSGSFISVDSVFISVEQSFDKFHWINADPNTPAVGGAAAGETKQALSVPFTWAGATGTVTANPIGHSLLLAPYARFIIRSDGNTAARMAALKANVVYRDVRDSAVPLPQMVTRRIKWGSFSANGFNVEKDTSSVRFSAPDTTQWIDATEMANGPANLGALVADSTQAFGNISLLYTDPSTSDSVYFQQEASPNKSEVFKVELKASTVYGMMVSLPVASAIPISTGSSDKSLVSVNFGVSHVSSPRQGGADLAPFLRWIIRGGNGGEVMGGTYGWITYFKVPRK